MLLILLAAILSLFAKPKAFSDVEYVPTSRLTMAEAMSMNRKARRALAKHNGIDAIPGTNRPIVRPRKPYSGLGIIDHV